LLGEGSEVGIVCGIELGLRRMTKGETAKFRVHSLLAYGSEGKEIYEIPPDADLDYIVELKSFVKVNGM
jgi:FKBP-type peptidyl-prolyl cis-trans isomerase